jgi:GMP synthase (glutamine-hydrolysing)
MEPFESLRFTLLQARNADDPARMDEYNAFADRLGIAARRLRQVDILGQPLDLGLLEDTDVLLVGGSGEYSVLDDHPAIRRFIEFLCEVADTDQPMFASCFGFQALALGLGGEVIEDDDHAEVGTYVLEVTEAGREDRLFSSMSATFDAQLGHKDRVSRLPGGVESLACTELCPIQAYRLPGKPVYATQFHAELSWLENKERFRGYMATYGALFGEQEALRKLYSHRPSPEANELLRRFVEEFGQRRD